MTQVLVRADASASIGSGHVMRCLALALGWRARGAQVRFACREHPGHLCELLESHDFEVLRLPTGQGGDGDLAHSHWLGAGWREDAEQVRAALTGGPAPDWLVVDHYALDRRWEDALRDRVGALLVIDDLADREHGPCLLLDQNLAREPHARYAGRVAEPSRWLLGPAYALLREEFARLHESAQPRTRAPQRLLLHFGGGPDPRDVAGRALAAVLELQLPDLEVEMVAGARAEELAARFGADARLCLHARIDTLAPLVGRADLALGAAGVSALERCCGGLPSLVLSMAENQRPGAEEMARRGLVRYLGHHDAVDDEALRRGLGETLAALPDSDWSRRCLDTVDGCGVERVLDAVAQGAPTPLHARRAILFDEQRLLDWANDPLTRANAFSPAPIPLEDHQRWLRARLADPGCRLYIVQDAAGEAVGTVRLQREAAGWEVHFNLAPAARGRGQGRSLVAAGIEALRAEFGPVALVFGRVKADNLASRRIFEGLGFTPASEAAADILEYRRAG
jgi:UDP-2,4-diacetamido-2,4,6-trideoxy-beta-L-altropyranose hydrolase